MARLSWSPSSLRDLEVIADFIARDSPHYARLTIQRIVSAVERLTAFPQSGRKVPEYGREDLREVFHGNYRIVYRARLDEIEVVTVVHGAQPLPTDPPP